MEISPKNHKVYQIQGSVEVAALKLLNAGATKCKIARTLHVDKSCVNSWLRRRGLSIIGNKIKITPDKVETIWTLMLERKSQPIIAASIGVSLNTLRNWFKSQDISYCSRKPVSTDDVAMKLREGYSVSQVANLLNVADSTVYRILHAVDAEVTYPHSHIEKLRKKAPEFKVEPTNIRGKFLYTCEKGHEMEMWGCNFIRSLRCPKCHGNSSRPQEDLADWIRTLGVQVSENVQLHLPGKNRKTEIDIFLPKHKLAIEYHGIYWHSDQFVDKNYHLDKYEKCKSLGITLIQIFSHEFERSPEIVKNIIKAKLYKHTAISARCCEIRPLDKNDAHAFFKTYHLQGSTPFIQGFGLWYKGELISGITLRDHAEGIELARFATKGGYRVRGGFSKLLAKAKKWCVSNSHVQLISYCDLRYSRGVVYYINDFEFVSRTKLDWCWVKSGTVYNRRSTWGISTEDCRKNGYHKLYGTGHLKFVLKIEGGS